MDSPRHHTSRTVAAVAGDNLVDLEGHHYKTAAARIRAGDLQSRNLKEGSDGERNPAECSQIVQLEADYSLVDLDLAGHILERWGPADLAHKQVGQAEPSAAAAAAHNQAVEEGLPVHILQEGADLRTLVGKLGAFHIRAGLIPDEDNSLLRCSAADWCNLAEKQGAAGQEELVGEALERSWAASHRPVQKTHLGLNSPWMARSSAADRRLVESSEDACTQLAAQEEGSHQRYSHLDCNLEAGLQAAVRMLIRRMGPANRRAEAGHSCNHYHQEQRNLQQEVAAAGAAAVAVAGCSNHSLYQPWSVDREHWKTVPNHQSSQQMKVAVDTLHTAVETCYTAGVGQGKLPFACTRRKVAALGEGQVGPNWLEVVADHILAEGSPHQQVDFSSDSAKIKLIHINQCSLFYEVVKKKLESNMKSVFGN